MNYLLILHSNEFIMSVATIKPLILELLESNPGKLMSSQEVYKLCLKKNPNVIKTSVYTTLVALANKGKIHKEKALVASNNHMQFRDPSTIHKYRAKTPAEKMEESQYFKF